MENINNTSAPKTVSADTKTSQNEASITSSIRYTCDVVANFENRIKTEPCRTIIDPLTGTKMQVLPKGGVRSLKDGAQSYYDRALLAEAKCDANLNRALLAESKNKTSFYGGLAGGFAIATGVVGLIVYIRKLRVKRHKGNE